MIWVTEFQENLLFLLIYFTEVSILYDISLLLKAHLNLEQKKTTFSACTLLISTNIFLTLRNLFWMAIHLSNYITIFIYDTYLLNCLITSKTFKLVHLIPNRKIFSS